MGALMRWLVLLGFEERATEDPAETLANFGSVSLGILLVNVIGSGVLGWLAAALRAASGRRRMLALGASVGFCGSFTTFSAFAVIVAEHANTGRMTEGAVYGFGSLLLALAAAWLGQKSRQTLAKRRGNSPSERAGKGFPDA